MGTTMLSDSQKASLAVKTERYEANLHLADDYLASRGITRAAAEMFRLGVCDGLVPGDEMFAGRLAIPYITADGSVVAIRYRAMDASTPKYLSMTGAETHLFGVSALNTDARSVVIAEGEIDAITLMQLGYVSVGVPGVQAWQKFFRFLFEDFDRIVVACDGDDAGLQFGRRMQDEIGAIPVNLPPGEDVNSVYLAGGRSAVEAIVGAA